MKIDAVGIVQNFKPVTVTIVLESQDEVDAFHRAGDTVYREHPSGSDEERLGMQMKNAISGWIR